MQVLPEDQTTPLTGEAKLAARLGKPPAPLPALGLSGLGQPTTAPGNAPTTVNVPGSGPINIAPPASPNPAPSPTPEVIQAQTPVGQAPEAPSTYVPPVSNPPSDVSLAKDVGDAGGPVAPTPGVQLPALGLSGLGQATAGTPNTGVPQITPPAPQIAAPVPPPVQDVAPPAPQIAALAGPTPQPPIIPQTRQGTGPLWSQGGLTPQPPPPDVGSTPLGPVATAGLGAPPEAISTFGPGNDLQAAQVNPVGSDRLAGIAGQSDAARSAEISAATPAPFNPIAAPGDYTPQADTLRARALTAQNLESLSGGPDRQQLAQDNLNRFIEDQNTQYEQRRRDVADQAASLGRIGSGMTADDIVRLGRTREQNIVREQAQLANDTAAQQLQDRALRLNAAQGVGSAFAGQDVTNAGVNQGLRGEARGERGAAIDYGQLGFGNRRAVAGDLTSAEQAQFDREAAQRGEIRGERGYQTSQAQQAVDNRARQIALEASLQGQDFQQAYDRARLNLDVAGTYDQQGQDAQSSAAENARQLAILQSLGIDPSRLTPDQRNAIVAQQNQQTNQANFGSFAGGP